MFYAVLKTDISVVPHGLILKHSLSHAKICISVFTGGPTWT